MYAFICYKCCIPCRLYVPSTLDQNPIDSKGLTICICLQSSLDLHRKSDEMQVLHMLQNASQVTKYLRISQSCFGISLGLLDILNF